MSDDEQREKHARQAKRKEKKKREEEKRWKGVFSSGSRMQCWKNIAVESVAWRVNTFICTSNL